MIWWYIEPTSIRRLHASVSFRLGGIFLAFERASCIILYLYTIHSFAYLLTNLIISRVLLDKIATSVRWWGRSSYAKSTELGASDEKGVVRFLIT